MCPRLSLPPTPIRSPHDARLPLIHPHLRTQAKPAPSAPAAAIMFQHMDEALMTFVNGLSVFVFFAIVGYHYITTSPKDME